MTPNNLSGVPGTITRSAAEHEWPLWGDASMARGHIPDNRLRCGFAIAPIAGFSTTTRARGAAATLPPSWHKRVRRTLPRKCVRRRPESRPILSTGLRSLMGRVEAQRVGGAIPPQASLNEIKTLHRLA